jgi:hypothetical protein
MIPVKLVGTPACRRYQRMHESVLREADRLGIPMQLEEIGDTESLSKINPLSLPRLYINDQLIASQNPPRVEQITNMLEQEKA